MTAAQRRVKPAGGVARLLDNSVVCRFVGFLNLGGEPAEGEPAWSASYWFAARSGRGRTPNRQRERDDLRSDGSCCDHSILNPEGRGTNPGRTGGTPRSVAGHPDLGPRVGRFTKGLILAQN